MSLLKSVDIAIIGGGPHALTVASRLVSETNESYSEQELNLNSYWNGKSGSNSRKRTNSILAIDPSGNFKENFNLPEGKWLSEWRKLFECLEINHLRSTVLAHPDPFDSHSLLAFANKENRTKELFPIDPIFQETSKTSKISSSRSTKQVRKNISMNFVEQFDRPSTKLFDDFCDSIVDKYGLEERIMKGFVNRIEPCLNEERKVTHYKLHLQDSGYVVAKKVIVATGQNKKRFPSWVNYNLYSNSPKSKHLQGNSFLKHALDPIDLDSIEDIKYKSIVIIGGGLTSVQLAIAAAKRGCSKVVLISKKSLQVKWFDLPLKWVGRFRNFYRAEYWNAAQNEDKLNLISEARGGGSVTPEVMQSLLYYKKLEMIKVIEKVEVTNCEWKEKSFQLELSNGKELSCNYLWLATGRKVNFYVTITNFRYADVKEDPLFQDMMRQFPIECLNGIPDVTNELRWQEGLDFFVTGAFATLQLGPESINLVGARLASQCIEDALRVEKKENIFPRYFETNVFEHLEVE